MAPQQMHAKETRELTDIVRVIDTFKTPNFDVVVHAAGHKLVAIHRMEVLYKACHSFTKRWRLIRRWSNSTETGA